MAFLLSMCGKNAKRSSSSFSARWADGIHEDRFRSWITARAPDAITVTGGMNVAGRNARQLDREWARVGTKSSN